MLLSKICWLTVVCEDVHVSAFIFSTFYNVYTYLRSSSFLFLSSSISLFNCSCLSCSSFSLFICSSLSRRLRSTSSFRLAAAAARLAARASRLVMDLRFESSSSWYCQKHSFTHITLLAYDNNKNIQNQYVKHKFWQFWKIKHYNTSNDKLSKWRPYSKI